MQKQKRSISVIVPVYNERENLSELVSQVETALKDQDFTYEFIIVDDGSTDGSARLLEQLQASRPWLRVIELRRNFGQTAALSAGFDNARGDIIVPMDGDLQNDPADIPRLIKKLDEGYDVVSGWRRDRRDRFLSRKMPSWVANWIIGLFTGVKLHDYGCTLKAYNREVVQYIHLYGEMHRFIPAIAGWAGAKVTEMVVRHHPRLRGRSKYGLNRTIKVVLDLITVKFLGAFSTKPLHIFGGMGLLTLVISFISGVIMLYQKFIAHPSQDMTGNPLFMLTVMCMIMSVQFLMMGLLAEMQCRTYHESQNKPTYIIRRIIQNVTDNPAADADENAVPAKPKSCVVGRDIKHDSVDAGCTGGKEG